DTASHRGRQWPLDGNHVIAHYLQGLFWQPGIWIVYLGGFFTGIDLHPGNLALATVGFLHGSVDDLDHYRTDVHTNAVAFYIRNDRIVRNVQGVIGVDGDFVTVGWHLDLLVS